MLARSTCCLTLRCATCSPGLATLIVQRYQGGVRWMVDSIWDIVRTLLLAARWTVVLSIVAFIGGGIDRLVLLYARIGGNRVGPRWSVVTCRCFRVRHC